MRERRASYFRFKLTHYRPAKTLSLRFDMSTHADALVFALLAYSLSGEA
jgi:hypothetical protein